VLAREPGFRGLLDVFVGLVFGTVAASNLVQGSWILRVPWLNLTLISLALAVPIIFFAMSRRLMVSSFVALLVALASISFGFIQPPASLSAHDKRVGLLITVAFILVASTLVLTTKRRLVAFCVAVVALGLIAVAGQYLSPDVIMLATGRRTPEGVNPIGAGRLIASALVIVGTAATLRSTRRQLIPLTVLAVPLIVGLVATGSRGPSLGVCIAALFVISMHPKLHLRGKALLTMCAIGAMYLTYRIIENAGWRLAIESGSGRSELYTEALSIAIRYPLGVGWGNFFRYARPSTATSQLGEGLYAHNIVLEFWIESGVVGTALLGLLLAIVSAKAVRQTRSKIGLILAALALSLLVGAMLSSNVVGNRMMWVTFGAILAGAALPRPVTVVSAVVSSKSISTVSQRRGTLAANAQTVGRRRFLFRDPA
jgi:O-antigen ligase